MISEPIPEIAYRQKLVSTDPDVTATFEELVTTYGCVSESHTVTTSDGYNLSLFRINDTNTSYGKKAVFLQHGLFSDSATWILNKEKSLAFVLAKAGYDVWLGNNRGNIYSRTNNNINIHNDQETWFNFSFYELGKYDAPA